MDNKIFLEKIRSKQSANTSSGLNVKLKGNRKLLPLNDVSDVISLMEQYTEEREKCNTIRLTCQVNPICSNILFNRISEIVKYEGSSAVTFLNYGISGNTNPLANKEQVIYKPETLSFWSGGTMGYQSTDSYLNTAGANTRLDGIDRTRMNYDGKTNDGAKPHPTNAIRDTQLSRTDKDGDYFVYHCGLDILNNHLIRSNTFKTICKMPATSEWETKSQGKVKPKNPDETGYTAFNTIADLMRDASGDKVVEKVYFPTTSGVDGGAKLTALHTYLYDDILTFNNAIKEKLIEKHNGWLGFLNRSKIKSYIAFKEDDPQDMRMERPLMYMNGGDYVDMYPGHDLYSFVPKYNKYRNRMEKNWNYCITYPSDSTIEGFDDIIEPSNDALKTIYFDENTRTDSGAMQLVMYSKAKHGLVEGDRVNIYKTNDGESELILASVEVDTVVNDFIFTTFTQGVQISKKWVELNDNDLMSGFTVDSKTYNINVGDKFFYDDDFNRYYIVNDKYVNIDPTAQNISYKKVVNGIEADYYVRIFSRLPNFRFANGDVSTEYSIYNKPIVDNIKQPSLLEEYQTPDNEFESHVSRLAFARNVYSDEIGEIVFTDDIDISNIHDNLGRPLTDIYLTIVKNNAGYKEWYGFDRLDCEISADTVEFSHCFGKITCGFEMSEESMDDEDAQNIRVINNVKGVNFGYNVGSINKERPSDTNLTAEEIDFKSDIHFYGDLCCYDGYNAIEESIQPMMHRFNTAQRECAYAAMGDYFKMFTYDEITKDDYDTGDAFVIKQYQFDDCNNKPEGYYYIPHYKIPIKTFGKLQSIMPTFLSIQSIINITESDSIQITTQQYHFLKPGDKAIIYDMESDKYYYLTAIPNANNNDRVFTCKVYDEKGNTSHVINGNNSSNYRLFKIDNLGIPSHAHLLKDGTCRYIWRDVINNGSMGGDKNIEEYPFTNGAFYINKHIDLYLRRQDPYGVYKLFAEDDISKYGVETPFEQINYYKSEDEISC